MRYLIYKLLRWALTYEQDQYKPKREIQNTVDQEETLENYQRRQLMDLNNKFMALCQHLGVYVGRNIPVSEWKVDLISDLKQTGGLRTEAQAAKNPTTRR